MAASHRHLLLSSHMSVLGFCLLAALPAFSTAYAQDSMATGKAVLEPGAAAFAHQQGVEKFGNAVIEANWSLDGQHLVNLSVTDRVHKRTIAIPAPFALVLADGSTIKASDMNLLSPPRLRSLPVDAKASSLALRLPGKAVQARFGDAGGRFRVDWQLVQRDGSPYLREEVSITALKQDEKIATVSLLETQVENAEVVGDVSGSPVVAGDIYLGFENPQSDSAVRHNDVKLTLSRTLPLEKARRLTVRPSSAWYVMASCAAISPVTSSANVRTRTGRSCITTRGTTSATSRRTPKRRRWTASIPSAKSCT